MKKILIVEDDLQIRNFLQKTLLVLGYDADCVVNAKECLLFVKNQPVDVVILDLGLPDDDGQNVITSIRSFSSVPIIVLSARSDTSDIVKALDSGANDYVKKPFDMPELIARIKSAISQHTPKTLTPKVDIYSFGNLTVDIADHKILINGEDIHLSKKEFLILKMLVMNSGKLVMQNDILQEVWGNCYGDGPQYLRVYIGQLRKKLGECNINPLISTENGVGYRIAASS